MTKGIYFLLFNILDILNTYLGSLEIGTLKMRMWTSLHLLNTSITHLQRERYAMDLV